MQQKYYHKFHIPVMGTGHSSDTPIRVAHLGISSVISLVDDLLLEKLRKYYAEKFSLPYEKIPKSEHDGRAKRITAYLNTVQDIVKIKFERLKQQTIFGDTEKKKYFEILPDDSPLKKEYHKILTLPPGDYRETSEKNLTDKMVTGSIDVNIMVKLDRITHDRHGKPLSEEFSDAKAALRGYANSKLQSAIVFSAGINQALFSYMTRFRDFYRDEVGEIKKKIILKVSDFRSALVQGKFLGKKGLEVHEFRIESGLNCGGHVFPSNGVLLPTLLREFLEKRDELPGEFQPLVKRYYDNQGMQYVEQPDEERALVTVQGGIGNHAEVRRLTEHYGMDRTGWASPFLLVPEATCVDDETRELLRNSTETDLYVSNVSPLGVQFNNIRGSGSERWTTEKNRSGNPGSACPKGFLQSNTEFTTTPICSASQEYLEKKLAEIDSMAISPEEKEELRDRATLKTCICDHLGNGALIALGLQQPKNAPQSICPGPNIAWFNRIYTLKEMVDHIYGRGESLVPAERPHMFAKEIEMYVDHFDNLVKKCTDSIRDNKTIQEFFSNLSESIEYCLTIGEKIPYPGENLESITTTAMTQRARVQAIYEWYQQQFAVPVHAKVVA
ncbi:MAG: hypothetical protein ACHQQQ_12865 [Bacteroidota bacterium]